MMALKVFQSLLCVLLFGFALILLVHAQDQSGFISIDCGASSSYTDSKTGINYTTDAGFISSGIVKSVSPTYAIDGNAQLLWTMRIFPQGTRNCYNVKLKKRNKYLIRATFLYGNYDSLSQAPSFDIHLGANFWDSVTLSNDSTIITKEIIHLPSSNFIYVCLVNTGQGTPLISGLEFRLLKNTTYVTQSGSLDFFARVDVASRNNGNVRFPDDVYDRIWLPYHFAKSIELSTNQTIDAPGSNDFHPPQLVMQTAATPTDMNSLLEFTVTIDSTTDKFYVFMHFAELQVLQANESRSFNVTMNGNYLYGPVIPDYLFTTTIYTPSALSAASYKFSLVKNSNSTLPPILNGVELYVVKDLFQAETVQQDVDAVTNIKSTYKLSKDWQGDPCSPQGYMWDGINCSFSGYDPPRIVFLNLSSTGLTGQIPQYIGNLTALQVLDLSNNSLTGSVPDFLSQLSSLKVLNLTGNNFTGSVPAGLSHKSKDGSLTLEIDSQNQCTSGSCESKSKKSSSVVVPVVASVVAVLVVVVVGLAIFLVFKKRQGQGRRVGSNGYNKPNNPNPALEVKNRRFTYEEILKITNNLETVIGEGGFGKVYLGYLDDNEIAVKILSVSSSQGYTQFQAEVNLLMRVHHRNLTTLVGYCDEENKIGLIYEYMANGDLSKHLSDKSTSILSWEGRLKIAAEAAQGLEYLHDGCKPPIVHRDVKTPNILLNDRFQAKIADFGLSKSFPAEGGTHVSHLSTVVAGTPGYLDPEYHVTGRLTEKSDVYSFGAVLLEIISCRPVIANTEENSHIKHWVNSMLLGGDIKSIVDKRLGEDFDTNSAWKAVEVAMACLSSSPNRRPTMNQVATELKECLAMEMARRRENYGNGVSQESSEDRFTVTVHTGMTPLAR